MKFTRRLGISCKWKISLAANDQTSFRFGYTKCYDPVLGMLGFGKKIGAVLAPPVLVDRLGSFVCRNSTQPHDQVRGTQDVSHVARPSLERQGQLSRKPGSCSLYWLPGTSVPKIDNLVYHHPPTFLCHVPVLAT